MLLLLLLLTGCCRIEAYAAARAAVPDKETSAAPSNLEFCSPEELAGRCIGVLTGTQYPDIVAKLIPSAELVYYNSSIDLFQALKSHKIDAYAEDESLILSAAADDDSISWIPEYIDTINVACAFPMTAKGEALREEFNAFVLSLKEDGTLDEMKSVWTGRDEKTGNSPPVMNCCPR